MDAKQWPCIAAILGRNGTSYVGAVNDDPEVKATLFKFSDHTTAYDLTFPVLRTRHTGTYKCYAGINWSKNGENQPSEFSLRVRDPARPRLIDQHDHDDPARSEMRDETAKK